MIIGISGTHCSGKNELVRFLSYQGFVPIRFLPPDDDNDNNNGETSLGSELSFSLVEDLVNHVTLHWREQFVLLPVASTPLVDALSKRPFFLHVGIDAPITVRHARCVSRTGPILLMDFATLSDHECYYSADPIGAILNRAQVKIVNTSTSVRDLYIKLSELGLQDTSRLRPSWDAYFMRLADLAALRSNCMKRRVGCVIVREMRVIATGYNGTPRHLTNCNEGGCTRCNQGQGSGSSLLTCLCLHAEENALLEAGRDRISTGSVLYCNTCPCLTCLIKIVQLGIKEVVYAQSYSMDTLSHQVMIEANIVLRQYLSPKDGIVV